MDIKKIHGHTNFIKGGTNSGVFIFRDKMALIIDPGRAPSRGRRLYEALEKGGIKARYVYTTHEHLDHYQSFYGLLESAPMVELFCFEKAQALIENPHMLHCMIYGASPPRWLEKPAEDGRKACVIRYGFSEGAHEINGKYFKITALPGHSLGSSGMTTEDGVIFLGDTVLDNHIIEKYDIPYLNNVKDHLDSLEKIRSLPFDWGLIAHGKEPYRRERILQLVDLNKSVLEKYIQQSLELLNTPYTREELLLDLLTLNDVKCDFQTWHYDYSTVGGILTFLSQEGLIGYNADNNKVYYYRI